MPKTNARRKDLGLLFAVASFHCVGLGLIFPLLPYYAKAFFASPATVGLLMATSSIMQLFFSPILGRWSDRLGRRPMLILSVCGTMIGYLVLGFADSLFILFLARMIDGITGGTLTITQAYITDVTDEKDRSKGLGLIGAAFAVGFIVGPLLGVGLNLWNPAIPPFVAVGLAGLNLLLILWKIKESPLFTQPLAQKQTRTATLGIWGASWHFMKKPRIGFVLEFRFYFGLALATFETMFILHSETHLGFSEVITNSLLVYIGIILGLTQGLAIGPLTRWMSEARLMLYSFLILCFSLLAWGFTSSLSVLLIVLIPITFANGILNTVVRSAISKVVKKEDSGGALGVGNSLGSLARSIAPVLGGVMFDIVGHWGPGFFAALLSLCLAIATGRYLLTNPAFRMLQKEAKV